MSFHGKPCRGWHRWSVDLNNLEHVDIRNTFFLRNVASGDGGALSMFGGTNITISNITCVGNHAAGYGACLKIDTATLTLNNSEISENVGQEYGVGINGLLSRIQVGTFHDK